MRGTRILTEDVAALRVQLDAARDKTSRYFDLISEMEKERNGWHKLHQEECIGHGNAQNLMMGTIEDMARTMSAKGLRFQIPRVLHAVREEFLQSFELPAREDVPLDKRKSGQLPPPTQPV